MTRYDFAADEIREKFIAEKRSPNDRHRVCWESGRAQKWRQTQGLNLGHGWLGKISRHNYHVLRDPTDRHFRKAGGALLVYDVTKEKTFESVTKWIEDLRY